MTSPWQNSPWEPRGWQRRAIDAWTASDPKQSPVIRAVTGAGKSVVIAELAWLEANRVVVTTPTVKLVDQLASTIKARGIAVGKYYTHRKDTKQRVIVVCNDSLAALAQEIEAPDLWIVDECHKSENSQVLDVVLGPLDFFGNREIDKAWAPMRIVGFTATPYRASDSERLSLFDTLLCDYGPAQAIADGVVVRPRVHQYDGDARTVDEACIEMIRQAKGPGLVDSINIADAQEFELALNAAGVRAKTVHSRLHEQTVVKRLALLERGELDCIVHVSLLSEGVDLPWLRWLCCRRPISSKVLFAQYVGRGLRQSGALKWGGLELPRKKVCEVFDPNDLFGKLSLDYEAVLSGDLTDDSNESIPELPALELDWALDDLKDSDNPPETLRGALLRAIDPLVRYVRRVHLALQFMGRASMKIGAKDWRELEPSQQQLNRIAKDAWVINEPDVPELHRRSLFNAIHAAGGLDRGTCSDLIAILEVLKYGWPTEIEQEVAA